MDYTIDMRRALSPLLYPILGDFLGLRGGDMLGPLPKVKPWTDADIRAQMVRLTSDCAFEHLNKK